MNRNQQSALLAGLLSLALAGCSSTKTGDEMAASGAGATSTSQAATAAAPATPATPATSDTATAATELPMATQAQTPATQGPSTMPGMLPNAVVVSIESVPRTGAATGAVGGSGGATGSSNAMDKQYRITLRMDDGATRVVTQDKAPAFRSGDRVNMQDGVISR